MSGMTLVDASEDAPVLLDLALEEDIAANLDHYILLSRQGFFEDANSFFEACLEKRASWFPIIWEYYNCQTIKNPYFDPVADRFLIQASRSYMQDSEERVLLDLIVNGVRRLDYSIKCLRGSVRAEVIRDIDIMTVLTCIRTLSRRNQTKPQQEYIIGTTLSEDLESYVYSLIESGYFWEAYSTLTADDHFLLQPNTRIECLECIWEAMHRPDFKPMQYGLDRLTIEILMFDVSTALGKTYIETHLFARSSKATTGRMGPAYSSSKLLSKGLMSILHRLEAAASSPSGCLTTYGSPCQSPRQQLDYTYVAIMQRILLREDARMLDAQGYQELQSLHDQATSISYLGLAQDISFILQTVSVKTIVSIEQFPQSPSSTLASSLVPTVAATPSMNLEKELTCGICNDILYRPLTLLDCLHTFCGGCIKEWFGAQKATKPVLERKTNQEEHLPVLRYTCPSCRDEVRDTRGNATITSLLAMYLQVHPEHDKSEEEKKELDTIYKRGDSILPPAPRLTEERAISGVAEEATISGTSLFTRNGESTSIGARALEKIETEVAEEAIMQLIMQGGLLDNIDLHNLTPAQEDAITERVALEFRRSHRVSATDIEGTRRRETVQSRTLETSTPVKQTQVQQPESSSPDPNESFSKSSKAFPQVDVALSSGSPEVLTTNNQQNPEKQKANITSTAGLTGPKIVDVDNMDEDAFATLDLVLEEDVAANLDHYVRLSQQGYFKDADCFFNEHLKTHAGWFPIVWEYFERQIDAHNHVRNGVEFLQHACRAYTHTKDETNLIQLMLESTSPVQEEHEYRGRLRDLLSQLEKDDIDIMTIKIVLCILEKCDGLSVSSTDLDAEISLYVNDLTDEGFFMEAYAAIDACPNLVTPTSASDCLSYLWDAINVSGLQPAEYGLDSESIQLLKAEILIHNCARRCFHALSIQINQSGDAETLDEQINSIKKMIDAFIKLDITGCPKQNFAYDLIQVLLYAIEYDTSPDKLQLCFEQLRERAELIGYNVMSDFLTRSIQEPEQIFERRMHADYQPREGLPAEPFPSGPLSLDLITRWQKHENPEAPSFTRSEIDDADISDQDLEEVKQDDPRKHILAREKPPAPLVLPKISTATNQRHPDSQKMTTSSMESSAGSEVVYTDNMVNTTKPRFVRALYDHIAEDSSKYLSFQQHEVIEVFTRMDTGWSNGVRIFGNKSGWFPSHYCVPMTDSVADIAGVSEVESAPISRSKSKKALYDKELMPSLRSRLESLRKGAR